MFLIFIHVMHALKKVAYAIRRLIGLAGVGIVKPIRYFESKTDIFAPQRVFYGKCYIGSV